MQVEEDKNKVIAGGEEAMIIHSEEEEENNKGMKGDNGGGGSVLVGEDEEMSARVSPTVGSLTKDEEETPRMPKEMNNGKQVVNVLKEIQNVGPILKENLDPSIIKIGVTKWKKIAREGVKNNMERGMDVNEECTFCKIDAETEYHALIDCPALDEIWSTPRFDFTSRKYHASILEWLVVEGGNWTQEQLGMAGIAMCLIWESRNSVMFGEEERRLQDLWFKVESLWDELRNSPLSEDADGSMNTKKWMKPPERWCKINTDAGITGTGVGVIAGVVRDASGLCLGAFAEHVDGVNNITLLEAEGMKKGLILAKEVGALNVFLEGDAALVFDHLKKMDSTVNHLNVVCKDILSFFNLFQEWDFGWAPRCCNRVAHSLVSMAKDTTQDYWWVDHLPRNLSHVMFFDS
ncbi:Ribonuclease H domain [Senna tora]|uniref:Ribonuclease H domain n=1 Tax=Senna tora TaxID=362788 RepID=A0A834T1T9_9FABA|nr:Ribonuclease H domain [Senna tora]